jgi:hypothetical protein
VSINPARLARFSDWAKTLPPRPLPRSVIPVPGEALPDTISPRRAPISRWFISASICPSVVISWIAEVVTTTSSAWWAMRASSYSRRSERHIAKSAHQPPASRALSRPRGARRSGQTGYGDRLLASPLRSIRYGSQEEHKPFKDALQKRSIAHQMAR